MTRQEAIKWLEQMLPTFKEGSQEWEVTTMAIESLHEPQKGEWIYGNGNGECSICGREKSRGWDNYCGYCGAKMEG